MAANFAKVENPLTLIAIFSGVAESITLAVLPILANSEHGLPQPLVWFAVCFPSGLVIMFFLTLNFNRVVLYAPSDFEDQGHFMSILEGNFGQTTPSVDVLKRYWKPDGTTIDSNNAGKIRAWMAANDLGVASISAFLYSNDADYAIARERAVQELGI